MYPRTYLELTCCRFQTAITAKLDVGCDHSLYIAINCKIWGVSGQQEYSPLCWVVVTTHRRKT